MTTPPHAAHERDDAAAAGDEPQAADVAGKPGRREAAIAAARALVAKQVGPPQQQELPFAVVDGVPVIEVPRDLYIPPQALEVFLEAFEGPLDLLLYLVRRQNLDILNIPIAEVTRQYVEYVELMKEMQLELAGEYLVMAALLAEIKSRLLLPRPAAADDGEENDPRAELVRRLQEYERFKQAAESIDALPRMGRDVLPVSTATPYVRSERPQPQVSLRDILFALNDVMRRAKMFSHHHVTFEPLSVRARMSRVLETLEGGEFHDLADFFDPGEGRRGLVVCILALLELVREGLVELVQTQPYAPVHARIPATPRDAQGAAS